MSVAIFDQRITAGLSDYDAWRCQLHRIAITQYPVSDDVFIKCSMNVDNENIKILSQMFVLVSLPLIISLKNISRY